MTDKQQRGHAMEIKDNEKNLWAAAYEEARGWGFAPKDAWDRRPDPFYASSLWRAWDGAMRWRLMTEEA